MKLTYEFVTGETTEVEISEEIGALVIDSRREEESGDRKERRHCISLDAITYEGLAFSTPDFTENMFSDENERNAHIQEAFSHLTQTQQRRMLMVAAKIPLREIARREGKEIKTIRESVAAARKKFLKFF
ncbi:hypothetical protein [Enterocloster clostridioformis]|uniref:hypothetical protein n=1 Tax=Enterocloster clostridioformis TaxID=1531 RepID=UPI0034A1CA3D